MDWSPPDADGLSSLRLDDPLRVSLKGQRRLRRGAPAPLDVDAWPREERELLAAWVRQAGERPIRHDTLLRAAGPSRAAMADRRGRRRDGLDDQVGMERGDVDRLGAE